MIHGLKGAALGLLVAGVLASATPAAAHYENYLFVPNRDSADVTMIDTRTDRIVARIKVGRHPHQVTISAGLGKLVAANTGDNTITIVDLRTLRPQATISLGAEPEHMALAADGRTLAVASIGAGTVSLISLTENRETARIGGLFKPHNLTFSPDGQRLFVANLGAGHVSVIDIAAGRVARELSVAGKHSVAALTTGALESYQGIVDVTATPDGRLGLAAHGESNSLSVIDLATGGQVKRIRVGDRPWRAYTPSGSRQAIVPNNGDGTLSVVSLDRLETVATLAGGRDVTGINGDGIGRTAFAFDRATGRALIVDLATRARAGEITLPGQPETGVTTLDGRKLYVALGDTGRVAVIDTRTRRLVRTIDNVGKWPWGATIAGAVNYCH